MVQTHETVQIKLVGNRQLGKFEGLGRMSRVKGEGKEEPHIRGSFGCINSAIKSLNRLTSSVRIHTMGTMTPSLQSDLEDSLR